MPRPHHPTAPQRAGHDPQRCSDNTPQHAEQELTPMNPPSIVTLHPHRSGEEGASLLGAPVRWLKRHPLLTFFALAFGLAWAVMLPMIAAERGMLPFNPLGPSMPMVLLVPLALLMAYAPTWAAIAVTGATEGKAGIGALLRRLLVWRVGLRWYAAALLGPAVWLLASVGLFVGFGGEAPPLPALGGNLLLTFAVQLLGRGLANGEEIGWRGFALPRLLVRFNALVSSLILGVLWTLFHLPIFFMQGANLAGSQQDMPLLGFLASTIAATVLSTWIFTNTRGSLLLAYLFHASVNTWTVLLAAPTSGPLFWVQTGLLVLAAVVVVAVFGPAHLSRKPVDALPVGIVRH